MNPLTDDVPSMHDPRRRNARSIRHVPRIEASCATRVLACTAAIFYSEGIPATRAMFTRAVTWNSNS
jgi:hypothetical protein